MLNRCILPLLLIAGLVLGAIPAATAAPVGATPTSSFTQFPGVAPRPSNLPGLESSEGASSSGAETIESQIVTILENDPKATRLSENQVTWRADNVVLTLTDDNTTAAGSWCGTGYVCVFSDINRTGYGYAFYDCGVYRLTLYGFPTNYHGGVSSWFNNQTGGAKVKFENPTRSLGLIAGHGFRNMPGYLNDRAYWLTLCDEPS